MKPIVESIGYKSLLLSVERDEAHSPKFHDYRAKLAWVIERVQHYAEKTGLEAADILNAWEEDRSYWYMNYYQETNQPSLDGEVRIFDTLYDLRASFEGKGFRCPACGGVSSSPQKCDSGIVITSLHIKHIGRRLPKTKESKVCDWKSYGLFGTLGKGASAFIKSELRVMQLFMPVAWESKETPDEIGG